MNFFFGFSKSRRAMSVWCNDVYMSTCQEWMQNWISIWMEIGIHQKKLISLWIHGHYFNLRKSLKLWQIVQNETQLVLLLVIFLVYDIPLQ